MLFLTQGKTNWRYILIVLILAVIVGGLTLYSTKIFPRIKRTPIINPPKLDKETVIDETELKEKTEETGEWKTYRNEEYGFEMRYPPDYYISQSGKGVEIAHVKWKNQFIHHPSLSLEVIETKYSIDKFAREEIKKARDEGYTVCPEEGFTMHCVSEFAEEIKIGNNIRTLRYKIWGVSGGGEIILVEKEPHPGWIIKIDNHIAGSRDPGEESIPKKVLDQMLSTFRFLE